MDKATSIYWVKGDTFCVVDGWCYGVNALGETVCVDKVEEVLKNES